VRGETTYHIIRCVESIRQKSTYDNYEIVLVHHEDDVTEEVEKELDRLGVQRLAYDESFNWSAVMNRGAAAATGDYLLFLNDDMEVITPDWIESLLEFAQQPDIGVVGGKLLFPNGELQHAGVVVADLTPRHAFYRFPGSHPGYFSSNLIHRDCSAVTGACLMTRAAVFDEVGGFGTDLGLNYNDIDYCLKVIAGGRRVVCTPHAQLYHYEGCTKSGTYEVELNAFRERWQGKWERDPYYNPNLSSHFQDYRIDLGQCG
jgi:GT2 family glycosyltransferase